MLPSKIKDKGAMKKAMSGAIIAFVGAFAEHWIGPVQSLLRILGF